MKEHDRLHREWMPHKKDDIIVLLWVNQHFQKDSKISPYHLEKTLE